MDRPKISKRQQAIYEYICNYSKEHGYPPSVREIGSAVGLASPSTVHMHLKSLEEKGYINRDSKKPRTIEVIDDRPREKTAVEGGAAAIEDPSHGTISLPLVGRVAAGVPILAEQNVEELVPMPMSVIGDTGSYLLRVRGTSMINAGIFDGDLIVVKEQHEAHDGEIIVAMIDDSATVKTFYREKDIVRLQPENDAMEPIYVRNPIILGRVIALIRSF